MEPAMRHCNRPWWMRPPVWFIAFVTVALLGRLPWPMLIFVGEILIAGIVQLVRGGKAQPGTATPGMPAHGMIGLLSGLFAKPGPRENPPARDRGEDLAHTDGNEAMKSPMNEEAVHENDCKASGASRR